MKLSLSWILDHIEGKKPVLDDKFASLVTEKFNSSVAEIDSCSKVSTNLDDFTVAEAKDGKLFSYELGKEIGIDNTLPSGSFYLLKKDEGTWRRATLADMGSCKDGVLPTLNISKDQAKDGWRQGFEKEDYILEVDNKAINHRPDLWGHRGFARELATLFNLEFSKLDGFLENVVQEKKELSATVEGFEVINEASPKCRRFSALEVNGVKNSSSDLKIATRLARVDTRPIDLLVDLTNYVMLDIGQPMHAFDADKFPSKKIIVRFAKPKEKLKLLDGSEVELTAQDIVIADKDKAISLAGIMGGESSGIGKNTTHIFLESANFEPTTIRKSAERAKVRTEASSRFEKGLDPNQNVYATERYLKLLKDLNVPFKSSAKLISLGLEEQDKNLVVEHEFLESRVGTKLEKDFVVNSLTKMGLSVEATGNKYKITVPSFRQDITILEDLVDEVARLYGFDNIPHILPARSSSSTDHKNLTKLRELKKQLAFSSNMMEVCNYPILDEQFLQELGWQPTEAIEIANPVSENWKRLTTSLVPLLLKNVFQNLKKQESFRFFEVARTWSLVKGAPKERNVLAGLFYSEKKLDFYDCKLELQKLFNLLGINVNWEKASALDVWFDVAKSAELFVDNKKIGVAGFLSDKFLKKSFGGHGFAFELDLDALLNLQITPSKFKAIPKYQATWLDISMMVPKSVDVSKLESAIKKSNPMIYKTELIDIFEKSEWKDKRSIAIRFHFVDEDKTLTKEEIDTVLKKAIKSLESLGAEIR